MISPQTPLTPLNNGAHHRMGSSWGKSRRWVPTFVGMIGVVLGSCANISTGKNATKTSASFSKVSPLNIVTIDMWVESKWSGTQLVQEISFDKSGFELGAKYALLQSELSKLGYTDTGRTIISGPQFAPVNSCSEDWGSENYSYYNDTLNMKNSTINVVQFSIGRVLVDGNCVEGLQELPILKKYEKKT